MRPNGNDRAPIFVWSALWIVALAVRFWGVWYFPTAEQDGYSDAETIARFSAEIAGGTFQFSHLYGFWLPLFQLVAAILNLWLRNPLLSGALISGVCGAIACVLTFAVALRLARSIPLAAIAFVIVLLSPMHLLYSSACMTDVPFGCLLLSSLLFVLRDQWTAAMIVAAVAGWVRVEAWTLIPLLPLLQFIRQRRVSVIGVIVLLAPPLLWLVVNEVARGDWFAFFKDRVVYQEHYMQFYPSRRGFVFADVRNDFDLLMFGANRAIFFAAFVAGAVVSFRVLARKVDAWPAFVTLSYLGVIFAFLILGYVTKRQPVLFPRYGLFALVLGTPLFMWLSRLSLDVLKPRWLTTTGISIVLFSCASEARSQYSIIPKVLADFRAHSTIAEALKDAMNGTNEPGVRCFSDDVSVRVLSGISRSRIVQSGDAPPHSWDDGAVFDAFLRQENVRFIVCIAVEDSLPARWLLPDGNPESMTAERFERVLSAKGAYGPDVTLMRLKL